MRSHEIAAGLAAVVLLVTGCGGSDDSSEGDGSEGPTTTVALAEQLRVELGELHLSRIAEIPDLRAIFHHGRDGTAVEDTSLDAGATWCRRATYTWAIEDAAAEDDFVIRYTLVEESPDCAATGTPFVLHVTGREQRAGADVLTGEYTTPAGLHVERTVCEETISDWPDVCGEQPTLPAPTDEASSA
ncbi:MAG: hypothetical protein H0V95_04940 [Actinobacteria bacterium]|nr:hypothetical protein [Actinomycetota bacterium]